MAILEPRRFGSVCNVSTTSPPPTRYLSPGTPTLRDRVQQLDSRSRSRGHRDPEGRDPWASLTAGRGASPAVTRSARGAARRAALPRESGAMMLTEKALTDKRPPVRGQPAARRRPMGRVTWPCPAAEMWVKISAGAGPSRGDLETADLRVRRKTCGRLSAQEP